MKTRKNSYLIVFKDNKVDHKEVVGFKGNNVGHKEVVGFKEYIAMKKELEDKGYELKCAYCYNCRTKKSRKLF